MSVEQAVTDLYQSAKESYAKWGVDTEKALEGLKNTPISLHCWQADDVGGFETPDSKLAGGGIQVTGNYPGRARNLCDVRQDLEKVFSLIPGKHRFNMHATYGDFQGKFVDRDEVAPKHFESWIAWAKKNEIGIDFNSTYFSHPKSNAGYSLSSKDNAIRNFWITHSKQCRKISNYIGRELGNKCLHNIWIPDGAKDITVDRFKHRQLLKESLDEVLKEQYPKENMQDTLESKLFGIGSESFVVGSHEFYLGYAIANHQMMCVDIGHFHPTESCADKVSALFQFQDELLFHVTRGIRWDSDHIVILDDPVRALIQEIVWADKLNKVHLGLDFFDATLNRIGAYVIGTRALQKAILLALLDPIEKLRDYENKEQYFQRLALLEEAKAMPFGAVWDYYCMQNNVPLKSDWIVEVEQYEKDVLSHR